MSLDEPTSYQSDLLIANSRDFPTGMNSHSALLFLALDYVGGIVRQTLVAYSHLIALKDIKCLFGDPNHCQTVTMQVQILLDLCLFVGVVALEVPIHKAVGFQQHLNRRDSHRVILLSGVLLLLRLVLWLLWFVVLHI